MSPLAIGGLGIAALLLLLALRMPLALALALVGGGGLWLLQGSTGMLYVLAEAPVSALSSYTLSVVPLFILMGAFASHGGLAEGLYRAAHALVGHRRGGLAIATIGTCAAFGAVCGSSIATVATMGRIVMPEMQRYRYSASLAAGSVAAGGTLGILIPPSVPMVLYAVLTETSVGKLFAAGVIPGLIAAALYALTIILVTTWRPALAPPADRLPWGARLRQSRHLAGMLLLFVVVVGGITGGVFSPTEGAAVGVGAAVVLGLGTRGLSRRGAASALLETATLSAALLFILLGIFVFEFFMNAAQFPQELAALIRGLTVDRWLVAGLVVLLLILLGCFLESLTVILIMTPVLHPIIEGLGFDLVWWGIVMVMTVEIGLITPPVGLNVYVMARMVPELDLWTAFRGVMPFVAMDVLRIALLMAFPSLVLWLPNVLE